MGHPVVFKRWWVDPAARKICVFRNEMFWLVEQRINSPVSSSVSLSLGASDGSNVFGYFGSMLKVLEKYSVEFLLNIIYSKVLTAIWPYFWPVLFRFWKGFIFLLCFFTGSLNCDSDRNVRFFFHVQCPENLVLTLHYFRGIRNIF